MKAADGILLDSSVYSADVTAGMKAFLERVGVVAAVVTMNHFLLYKEVMIVGAAYWNMVYGKDVGDELHDREGVENMKNLRQNMAWLLRRMKRNKWGEARVQ